MGIGGKLVIALTMAVSVLLVYMSIEFVPDEGETVLFERHDPVRVLSPGWYLLSPFDQSVRMYPVEESFSLEHGEERIYTREREFFDVEYVLRWSICDTMRFAQLPLPYQSEMAMAETRLREAALGAVRVAMARVSNPDDLATDDVRTAINEYLDEAGICVSDFRVTSVRE